MAVPASDRTALSKTLARALRHRPQDYGLALDAGGWVPVGDVLAALPRASRRWAGVTRADLEAVIRTSDKQRYEIVEDRIRARYGHSTRERVELPAADPPPVLFHGTDPALLPVLRADGLRPMRRQYVHLSADVPTATAVGRRKARSPVVLRVRAAEAAASGVVFRDAGGGVWLADAVPSAFLVLPGD